MELLHKYLLKEWISEWQTEFQHKFLAHDFKYLDILICLNERHRVRHLGYKWEKNYCIACSSRSSSIGMDRHYQPYNQINLRFNSEKCSKVEVAPTERADNGAFELDRVTRECWNEIQRVFQTQGTACSNAPQPERVDWDLEKSQPHCHRKNKGKPEIKSGLRRREKLGMPGLWKSRQGLSSLS